jgi:hypothetical protein
MATDPQPCHSLRDHGIPVMPLPFPAARSEARN